jgi:glycerol-1-phosphate dehydrogenase [NAD(P)+]
MSIWPTPRIEIVPFADWEESRSVALLTSPPAWEAVKDRLHLPVTWRAEVVEASETHWLALAESMSPRLSQIIYAVGGGLVADAAKHLAARHALPLVCMPTVLSVDAFFTWASGVREGGCVRYLETRPPDRVVIDWDVIAGAPPSLRAAGICDVLSIATGSWDWRFAQQRGLNPPGMEYQPWADQVAAGILVGVLDCAEAAGRGDPAGLKQLLDCLVLEVQLCNQLGHARPEEGSEHYIAYAAENETGPGWAHGALVGPGLLLAAERQGQDSTPLRRALEACHVPVDRLPASVVESTLRQLPEYVRRHGLPYAIAHEWDG